MKRNYSAHVATGCAAWETQTTRSKTGSQEPIEWNPFVFIPVPDAIESNSESAWRAWDQAQDELAQLA